MLDNDFNLVNYSVKYQIKQPKKFDMWGKNRLDTLNQIVYTQTSIDDQHLIWSTENFTGLNDAINFERYGDNFFYNFLNYISTFADEDDILFLENLKKYNYAKIDYEKEKFDKYLQKAKTNYGQ